MQLPDSKDLTIELLDTLLARGVSCQFRAKGRSMTPFIRDGDTITLSPLSHSSPCLGDIIAFVHPATERLLVHRVIGKSGDTFLMRGDNTQAPDGSILMKNVLGRVTGVRRNGKKVHLGLGAERFLILLLTRSRFLFRLLLLAGSSMRSIVQILNRTLMNTDTR